MNANLSKKNNYVEEIKKENLILLHSFPTNSILLSGLTEFLSQYFSVIFIDLPGFVKSNPPLKIITLENYTKYVENRINELNLESYVVGGISFGFYIISEIRSLLSD